MSLGGNIDATARINQTAHIQATEKIDTFAEAKQNIREALVDLADEMQIFSAGLKKDKKIEQPDQKQDRDPKLDMQKDKQTGQIEKSDEQFQQQAQFLTQHQRRDEAIPEKMSEFLATIIQEEKVNKKGKKSKTSFEQKLEKLAGLEDDFKMLDLEPQDKELVEEFFDRLNRMKNLKTRLKQLEYTEKRFEEEEKKRQKQQKNHKNEKDEEETILPNTPSHLNIEQVSIPKKKEN